MSTRRLAYDTRRGKMTDASLNRSEDPLRVLLTNTLLEGRTGSELVVYETALNLQKAGHRPIVFSPLVGEVANLLVRSGVPVVNDISVVQFEPDVIHAQHHLASMIAALRFPRTPVVSFCHGWLPWVEKPIATPNVVAYVAVSELTRERIITTKGTKGRPVHLIRNWFDPSFELSCPVSPSIGRALIYNNSVNSHSTLFKFCEDACSSMGISLDIVGRESGRVSSQPHLLLPGYDLVFAVGRSAIESLASGRPTILADTHGVFGLVTPENFARCQAANFGLALLDRSRLNADFIASQIELVDISKVSIVADRVRREHSSYSAFVKLESVYRAAVASNDEGHHERSEALTDTLAAYLSELAPLIHNLERNRLPKLMSTVR